MVAVIANHCGSIRRSLDGNELSAVARNPNVKCSNDESTWIYEPTRKDEPTLQHESARSNNPTWHIGSTSADVRPERCQLTASRITKDEFGAKSTMIFGLFLLEKLNFKYL
jgi:hypothetical protein